MSWPRPNFVMLRVRNDSRKLGFFSFANASLNSVTSQLFLQAPKLDDQLPVSPDGGLADIHVTAFLSAIDSLLTAARSSSPTRVLTPMKAVVNAVTAIVEDIRACEERARSNRG